MNSIGYLLTQTKNTIKDEGIKSFTKKTMTYISNGQKKTTDNSPNIRQGLCQLDRNNFVFLTNISSNRSIGLSFSKMADIFNSMGCIYGVNLDGGGSTSLYYKERGTNNATEVRGSSREVADMLYFVEQ